MLFRSPNWICRSRLASLVFLVGFACALPLGCSVCARASERDNIAPRTPYVLSPAPNYSLATGVPGQVLTDGRRAGSRFWVGPDSVGWYYKSPVIYRQTFRATRSVERVEIATGQALRSEVSLPANAFVYLESPAGGWTFAGDAAALAATPADGPRMLALDLDPVEAKAITIVVYRNSPYLSLDEVRILVAPAGRTGRGAAVDDILSDAKVRRIEFAEQRAGTRPIGLGAGQLTAWPLSPSAPEVLGCRAIRIAPWTESDPATLARAPAFDGASANAVGGWLVGLVRIENASREPAKATLTPSRSRGVEPPQISLGHYVLALDYRWRADVLLPAQEIMLPPRSFTVAVVRSRVTAPGDIQAAVEIACNGTRQSVAIAASALQIEPEDRPFGTTWSYLLGPSRNLLRCGTQLEEEAWIDTAVVNASALAPDRRPPGDAELRRYLRAFAGSRRLLLFMDLATSGWARENDLALEQQLENWWQWVSRTIREEGYRGQVLFYPLDESREEQLPRLQAAIRSLRKIAPGVPIYATIGNAAAMQVPDIDVRQFHDSVVSQVTSSTPKGSSPEIYATANYAKTLGLSYYFRRLGWLAFAADFKGAGVWSMWDANGADQPRAGWTDFGGIERDFNLVYADSMGCPMPSRRLLAFQRGLEDFALMNACMRRGSGVRAREVARTASQFDRWVSLRQRSEESAPEFDTALTQAIAACK